MSDILPDANQATAGEEKTYPTAARALVENAGLLFFGGAVGIPAVESGDWRLAVPGVGFFILTTIFALAKSGDDRFRQVSREGREVGVNFVQITQAIRTLTLIPRTDGNRAPAGITNAVDSTD